MTDGPPHPPHPPHLLSAAALSEIGWASARRRSDALDLEVARLLPDARLAIVAMGSWGRRELCPHSDIDLLVLWGGRRGAGPRDVEPVLYPLWDSGRRVGHAVRTPKQCVEVASSDLTALCGLLDSRLVAGRADLFDDMCKRVFRHVRRTEKAFLAGLADADARRHARWGHTGRLARPNLKEGRGGLRDAASLRWRAAGPDLDEEIGVLLAVRSLLHEAAGRAEDVLAPEFPDVYAHTSLVYAAARRIALAHRVTPVPDGSPLEVLHGDPEDALDAFDARPPDLPGWDAVQCRPPANVLHTFAVDTHLVAAAVDAARPIEGFDADVKADVLRPDLLVLAALVHDIGKGADGDHSVEGASIARRAGAALGLPPEDCETLAILTRHHLLLADIATRRDLADEAELGRLMLAVGDVERLRMLYLLTRSDARATGDTMWGEWRASLVREAFVKTLELFAAPERDHLGWRRGELRQVLARHHPLSLLGEIDSHLDGLPASYFGAFPTPEQVEHFALMRPRPAPGEIRMKVIDVGETPITLLVAACDRPGLVASVSAALTVHGIDVLSARIFTRSDGVALESYRVADQFGERIDALEWEEVRADIGTDMSERLTRRAADYAARTGSTVTTKVSVDDHRSLFYTVVEVRAPDSVGLLARLAGALHELGLDIHVAKIVTEGPVARDTFYVWDAGGGKVGEAQAQEIVAALESASAPPQ